MVHRDFYQLSCSTMYRTIQLVNITLKYNLINTKITGDVSIPCKDKHRGGEERKRREEIKRVGEKKVRKYGAKDKNGGRRVE